MLDNEEYHNPYIEIGNYKLEFNRAPRMCHQWNFNGEKIHSDVIIIKFPEPIRIFLHILNILQEKRFYIKLY